MTALVGTEVKVVFKSSNGDETVFDIEITEEEISKNWIWTKISYANGLTPVSATEKRKGMICWNKKTGKRRWQGSNEDLWNYFWVSPSDFKTNMPVTRLGLAKIYGNM
jgi:hypothetical protein